MDYTSPVGRSTAKATYLLVGAYRAPALLFKPGIPDHPAFHEVPPAAEASLAEVMPPDPLPEVLEAAAEREVDWHMSDYERTEDEMEDEEVLYVPEGEEFSPGGEQPGGEKSSPGGEQPEGEESSPGGEQPEGDKHSPGKEASLKEKVKRLSTPVESRTIYLCRPLASTKGADVLLAVQEMLGELDNAGLVVKQVHSDRGKQLVARPLREYFASEGLYHTKTAGLDPAGNGAAERGVGWVKGAIKVLMHSAAVPAECWPLAACHACSRQLQERMGVSSAEILPFASKVWFRVKRYNAGGKEDLLPRWEQGLYMCPSPDVTAGHVVLKEDGNLVVSKSVRGKVYDLEQELELELGASEALLPAEEPEHQPPRRRVVGKSAPEALLPAEPPAPSSPRSPSPAEGPAPPAPSHRVVGKSAPEAPLPAKGLEPPAPSPPEALLPAEDPERPAPSRPEALLPAEGPEPPAPSAPEARVRALRPLDSPPTSSDEDSEPDSTSHFRRRVHVAFMTGPRYSPVQVEAAYQMWLSLGGGFASMSAAAHGLSQEESQAFYMICGEALQGAASSDAGASSNTGGPASSPPRLLLPPARPQDPHPGKRSRP